MNTGLRNPVRNSIISGAILAGGLLSVGLGVLEMRALDWTETPGSGLKIGLGLFAVCIGAIASINFLRGVAAFRALRSGRNQVARWRIGPAEFERFRANDAARDALGPEYRNALRLPRRIPPEGLEILFGRDSVLVGDTYYGLSSTGLFRFSGVQMLPQSPLAIEFGTVATTMWQGAGAFHVDRSYGVLRVPVGPLARNDAVRVLRHFEQVDQGRIRIHERRYRRALKGGLIAAAICGVMAAWGLFAMPRTSVVALTLAVVGAVGGLGALVYSAVAAGMLVAERKGR